jgi:hypothetical protein
MDLSPEMSTYITTGRCPHCNAVLLSVSYITQKGGRLEQAALRRAQNTYRLDALSMLADFAGGTSPSADEKLLSGPGRKAELVWLPHPGGANQSVLGMKCQMCGQKWSILPLPEGRRSRRERILRQSFPQVEQPQVQTGAENQPPRIQMGARLLRPNTPLDATGPGPAPDSPLSRNRTRSIDLSGCSVTDLQEEKPIEVPWYTERNIYPNNTAKSAVTKKVNLINEHAKTVTIESDKLKAHNAGANVNILGFAAIQGQVQQQVGERYSVATQNTITFSEETTIEIPPGSAVEHVIQWIFVYHTGLAILGQPSDASYSRLAEVPYRVLWRNAT